MARCPTIAVGALNERHLLRERAKKEGTAGSRALRGSLSSGDQDDWLRFVWPCYPERIRRGADNSELATYL